MILFYTLTSPFARITRAAVLELNLSDRIDMQETKTRVPVSPLYEYNPTGRVPTLTTAEGFILSETRVICAYLDQLSTAPNLMADISDTKALQLEGTVNGFLDGIAVWVRELRRPENERSPGIIEQEHRRALRCLDYFESIADSFDQQMTFSQLMLACTLDTISLALKELDWPQNRHTLTAWHQQFSSKPSLQETAKNMVS